jgi:hypothetical protein
VSEASSDDLTHGSGAERMGADGLGLNRVGVEGGEQTAWAKAGGSVLNIIATRNNASVRARALFRLVR